MNCKQFSKVMGEYVNRTLGEEIASGAEAHLKDCAKCASLVRELENTSRLVRSLEREAVPAGFEARLKARLASPRVSEMPSGAGSVILGWLRAIGRTFSGAPGHGWRLVLRPALAGLILCAIIAGSLFMVGRGQYSEEVDTDWGYIETCRDQHASFAAANPLADESAVILRERARDLAEKL